MDFDSFLTSPRWEILQMIAEKPSSPFELSAKLNTTVSYISQQLKLLDAAGLVIKEKTGASLKGKPRTLFTISKELAHISLLSRGFSKKKLLNLTEHNKRILKIWIFVEPEFHNSSEKLLGVLENDLESIEMILVARASLNFQFYVVSSSKRLKSKVQEILKTLWENVSCNFISKSDISKFSFNDFVVLFDPLNLTKELKGGLIKGDV